MPKRLHWRTPSWWKFLPIGWWGLVFVLGFIGIGRLFWLQIWKGRSWQAQAEENRLLRVSQRAPRGEITDRNGRVVAQNEVVYTELRTEENQKKEQRIDHESAVSLMATAPAQVRRTFLRRYPYGPVLAPVVGYIQRPLTASDIIFGRAGVEAEKNNELAGQDGYTIFERNALGKPTRVLQHQEPTIGQKVELTIDAELSRVAFDALGGQRGTVLVSHPRTGEVLVAVSTPGYLPLNAGEEVPAEWQSAVDSKKVAPNLVEALDWPNSPFLFRPTAALYPPGSLFKIVTALAGLERQAITATTTVRDEGVLTVGDFSYQNWYWRQYGRVEGEINVVRALARSNDIFFYKLAEWVGPESLADFAHFFSLGEKTGVGWLNERSGLVPTPSWKQQHFGEKWYLGNTYHYGIGQGDLLVTPMQLQVMMSTVAMGGRRCSPQFFKGETPSCQEVSLQPQSLELVVQGLRQACSTGGTAFPFFTVPYDVMCKTGTAEFGAANEEGHRPTHGWFSLAVADQERQEPSTPEFEPDIIITVLIESDEANLFKEGSRDAAPVALTVANWWIENR